MWEALDPGSVGAYLAPGTTSVNYYWVHSIKPGDRVCRGQPGSGKGLESESMEIVLALGWACCLGPSWWATSWVHRCWPVTEFHWGRISAGVHDEVWCSLHSPSPWRGYLSWSWAIQIWGRGEIVLHTLFHASSLISVLYSVAIISHLASLALVKVFFWCG